MRQFLVSSVAVLLAFAGTPAHAQTISAHGPAPADVYFGHYRMSVLGIRNAVHDMLSRAQSDVTHAGSYMNSADLAEDAIYDWQRKYPEDSWIPEQMVTLEKLYVVIGSDEAQTRAIRDVAWLDERYPGTPQSRKAHDALRTMTIAAQTEPSYGMVPALAPAVSLPTDMASTSDAPAAAAPTSSVPSYAQPAQSDAATP